MLLAAGEAAASEGVFNGFDVFLILFTILILFAVVRLVTAKQKNLFAIGFAVVSLIVFLIMDYNMVKAWLGLM